jgi:xylan 1,4-beta-xylosidase
LAATYALAAQEQVHILGAVNWSFEFEDQPYFEGFRELATNGIDKPVLNAFRMFGLLGDQRIKVSSSRSLPIEQVVSTGVQQQPDIRAIATRHGQQFEIMIWNYHDEDVAVPATPINLTVTGLTESAPLALLEHFRVDHNHSNAFTAWKEMGSPQSPSPEQRDQLQRAGQLQLLTSPAWIPIERGTIHLQFTLPRQGVSLVRLTW